IVVEMGEPGLSMGRNIRVSGARTLRPTNSQFNQSARAYGAADESCTILPIGPPRPLDFFAVAYSGRRRPRGRRRQCAPLARSRASCPSFVKGASGAEPFRYRAGTEGGSTHPQTPAPTSRPNDLLIYRALVQQRIGILCAFEQGLVEGTGIALAMVRE